MARRLAGLGSDHHDYRGILERCLGYLEVGMGMTTNNLYAEWDAIIARRIRCGTSGQDGNDFATWLKWRGLSDAPQQLELF